MGVTTASPCRGCTNPGLGDSFTWDPTSLLEACQVTSQHFGPFPGGRVSANLQFPYQQLRSQIRQPRRRDLTSKSREDNTIVLRTEVLWFFFWRQR